MANYYSDHYAATVGSTAADTPKVIVAPGIDHSTLRYKRAVVTPAAGVTDDEICRMFRLRSSDRLIALYLSSASMTGTTMTSNCGLYETDDGVLIDLDVLGAAANDPWDDLSVAVPRTECFTSGFLENEDRGKFLWQLTDENDGDYSVDPNETWDVCITMDTETAITAAAEIVLEAYYTAGGN